VQLQYLVIRPRRGSLSLAHETSVLSGGYVRDGACSPSCGAMKKRLAAGVAGAAAAVRLIHIHNRPQWIPPLRRLDTGGRSCCICRMITWGIGRRPCWTIWRLS